MPKKRPDTEVASVFPKPPEPPAQSRQDLASLSDDELMEMQRKARATLEATQAALSQKKKEAFRQAGLQRAQKLKGLFTLDIYTFTAVLDAVNLRHRFDCNDSNTHEHGWLDVDSSDACPRCFLLNRRTSYPSDDPEDTELELVVSRVTFD